MKIIHETSVLQAVSRIGEPKFWKMQILTDGEKYYHRTSSWRKTKTGKLSIPVESEPYEVVPKNIGKANETTAKEQAFLEMDSVVKKQKDKGYVEEGNTTTIYPLPMLAQKFSERGMRLAWPVFVQPKYNGMRMLYDGKRAWSRGGKDIIPEVIEHLQFNTNGYIVDGELMLPNNVPLQETMRASKKYRPELSTQLIYIIYDVIDESLKFDKRYEILKNIHKNAPKQVIFAPTNRALDVAEVMTWHTHFTALGYEGTIIRDCSEGYQIGQRSNQLQKLKDFIDSEFKIIDVVSGGGSFAECAIFVCTTEAGKQFNCTPEGTMEYRKELLKNKNSLIGKWLTIRYQELSNDAIPIFPVGVDIRERTDF